jgi:hypothetical protein
MILLICSDPPRNAVSAAEVANLSTYSMKLVSSCKNEHRAVGATTTFCAFRLIFLTKNENSLFRDT